MLFFKLYVPDMQRRGAFGFIAYAQETHRLMYCEIDVVNEKKRGLRCEISPASFIKFLSAPSQIRLHIVARECETVFNTSIRRCNGGQRNGGNRRGYRLTATVGIDDWYVIGSAIHQTIIVSEYVVNYR